MSERANGQEVGASSWKLRTTGLTWRKLDDQVVVLDLESSLYLNVTGAGAVVWSLLAAGTTLDAMVDAVLEVYDADAEVARNDLAEFVADLTARGMIGASAS